MPTALIPILALAIGFAVNLATQRYLSARYDYRCPRCGATVALSPVSATIAPHRLGGTKFMKCSSCGKRSWMVPVPKS